MRFDYYSGSGNLFLISICQSSDIVLFTPDVVQQICQGTLSRVDGLLLLEPNYESILSATFYKKVEPRYAFTMHYFNCDGSSASMCGNGLRAIAKYAYDINLPTLQNKIYFPIKTACGFRHAQIFLENDTVEVEMGTYSLRNTISQHTIYYGTPAQETRTVYSLNTGVPHAVIMTSDIVHEPVLSLGNYIRYHSLFKPQGTNVNFIRIHPVLQNTHPISIRTYERGVENETGACGTGAAAAALIHLHTCPPQAYENERKITITFSSGEVASIRAVVFKNSADITVQLYMKAKIVFSPEKSIYVTSLSPFSYTNS